MKIELPQVGESVTEGIIGRWLKQVGDRVEKYDPLVEVVTDKVNMEMPSPVSGVLTSIVAAEGQTVPMGEVIAEIAVEGEKDSHGGEETEAAPGPMDEAIDRIGVLSRDIAPVGPTGSGSLQPVAESGGVQQLRAEHKRDAEPAAAKEEERGPRERKRYSPAVSRLARENRVDLSLVTGTGIDDRVTRRDVEAFIASHAQAPEQASTDLSSSVSSPEEERVPLTPVRRIVADNMARSATEIPQAWSLVEVDVSGLVRRREALREEFRRREGINLTYLPFTVKAVAEALRENPILNSSWGGDCIILKRRINIGVAVAAPDGLVVPVVRDADTLSVADLAKAMDSLTERARGGNLAIEDVQNGTLTVNNTGALGSVLSRPLVNHPQAAIVTTELIVRRAVVVGDAIAIRSMMNVCLSFDHRILDGSEASAFINDVKRRLEAIGPETGIY